MSRQQQSSRTKLHCAFERSVHSILNSILSWYKHPVLTPATNHVNSVPEIKFVARALDPSLSLDHYPGIELRILYDLASAVNYGLGPYQHLPVHCLDGVVVEPKGPNQGQQVNGQSNRQWPQPEKGLPEER